MFEGTLYDVGGKRLLAFHNFLAINILSLKLPILLRSALTFDLIWSLQKAAIPFHNHDLEKQSSCFEAKTANQKKGLKLLLYLYIRLSQNI